MGLRQYQLEDRELDIYELFREAFEEALREGVNAILISGDLFDKHRPFIRSLDAAVKTLKMAEERGVPVLAVLGEHDLPKGRDLPPHTLLPHIKVLGTARKPLTYRLTVEGREYVIAGISHHPPSLKGISYVRSKLREVARELPPRRNVLRMHQNVRQLFRLEEGIEVSDLPRESFYVAMGHLHFRKYLRLEGGGLLAYPGSLDILRSDEIEVWLNSGKGFYLADLSGDEPRVQEVNLDVRPQLKVSVRYPDIRLGIESKLRELRELASRVRSRRRVKGILHVTVEVPEEVKVPVGKEVADLVGGRAYLRLAVVRVGGGAYREVSTGAGPVDPVEVLARLLIGLREVSDTERELATLILKLKDRLSEEDFEGADEVVKALLEKKERLRKLVKLSGLPRVERRGKGEGLLKFAG